MKTLKSVFLLFWLAIVLHSCISDMDERLHFNLTAPNGEILASSIDEVRDWTAVVIRNKIGEIKQFEISDIKFLDVNQGYVAQISYKTAEGFENHYYVGTTSVGGKESRNSSSGDCTKWEVTCSGNSCCTPHFNLNTNEASCSCSSGSSSGCVLTVECKQQSN